MLISLSPGLASNYTPNRPETYSAASSAGVKSVISHKLDYEQMKSAGYAWLAGTTPSNPGSATSGAGKQLGQSGTYHTQPTYATSPSLEVYKTSQVLETRTTKFQPF